ncbi:helix-turn-helix transcriptional regulator [Frankia sp. AgB1.9]|uniref:helix-turn-helix transcriptional regulator n=1 Tax=unclassified Frankia TaxID=2632575 RepID=UPI0019312012|nr:MULTISPECIES: helix-turn-helix transcriptional regulator [unclassified Frankia]MBL7491597.1 helix-turn-helix transcriptional regulator [Frankia sp. AgW1.1]MBL7554045.1 helix-turn-helix transcriptional regulator [Frankia sp. AgB1.9]MBL7618227.1 helix-turn-helix transcriptional regulator [Frankia sp. AgB1.8]
MSISDVREAMAGPLTDSLPEGAPACPCPVAAARGAAPATRLVSLDTPLAVARALQALGDPASLRLFTSLRAYGDEVCGCHIAELLAGLGKDRDASLIRLATAGLLQMIWCDGNVFYRALRPAGVLDALTAPSRRGCLDALRASQTF